MPNWKNMEVEEKTQHKMKMKPKIFSIRFLFFLYSPQNQNNMKMGNIIMSQNGIFDYIFISLQEILHDNLCNRGRL
jgi:hypothetical protein